MSCYRLGQPTLILVAVATLGAFYSCKGLHTGVRNAQSWPVSLTPLRRWLTRELGAHQASYYWLLNCGFKIGFVQHSVSLLSSMSNHVHLVRTRLHPCQPYWFASQGRAGMMKDIGSSLPSI